MVYTKQEKKEEGEVQNTQVWRRKSQYLQEYEL